MYFVIHSFIHNQLMSGGCVFVGEKEHRAVLFHLHLAIFVIAFSFGRAKKSELTFCATVVQHEKQTPFSIMYLKFLLFAKRSQRCYLSFGFFGGSDVHI